MARQGELRRIGAQRAIDDVNTKGGITALSGAKFKLVIEYAGDKMETAKNAAQRWVSSDAKPESPAWYLARNGSLP